MSYSAKPAINMTESCCNGKSAYACSGCVDSMGVLDVRKPTIRHVHCLVIRVCPGSGRAEKVGKMCRIC